MREKIISVIAAEFGLPETDIKPESSLRLLAGDSLELVSLSLTLQAQFGIEISDGSMRNFRTVGDILAYMVPN